MDGDFAPMAELAKLHKKHGFLFVIDDAGSFVFSSEDDVDTSIVTLSKAAGWHGGFIACSKKWKLLIQSTGRSFIFSTSTQVPVAAARASVIVARKEAWRRSAIQKQMHEFHALTGIPIESHIILLVVGSEEKALQASRLNSLHPPYYDILPL